MIHFEYLLELGEVQAIQTVTTLVDGMEGREKSGITIVEPREGGDADDHSDYVGNFFRWKAHFPQLRMSKGRTSTGTY
jgi:hypothetical protein